MLKEQVVFTMEQEVELMKKIEGGDQEAKNQLIKANLRLVTVIVKQYITGGNGLEFEDLFQEGTIGLIKAIEKFDYRLGFRFSTYAVWWIKRAITRVIAKEGRVISLPLHKVEDINKYFKTLNQLTQKLGQEPLMEEVAKEMGMPIAKIVEISKIAQRTLSLECLFQKEEDNYDNKFNSTPLILENIVMEKLFKKEIEHVLKILTPKEKRVIRLRFGFEGETKSLRKVAQECCVTYEKIRYTEKKALNKLRKQCNTLELKEFLY